MGHMGHSKGDKGLRKTFNGTAMGLAWDERRESGKKSRFFRFEISIVDFIIIGIQKTEIFHRFAVHRVNAPADAK